MPCTTKSLLASRDLLIRPRHGLRHISRFSKSILTSIFLAPIYQFLKKQLNPNENYSKISSEGGLYTCQLSRLFLCRRISCVLLRFVGRKRRSTSSQIMGHMLGDRDARIRLLDHQDCNAFSDCRPVPALVGVSVWLYPNSMTNDKLKPTIAMSINRLNPSNRFFFLPITTEWRNYVSFITGYNWFSKNKLYELVT